MGGHPVLLLADDLKSRPQIAAPAREVIGRDDQNHALKARAPLRLRQQQMDKHAAYAPAAALGRHDQVT